MHHFMNLQGGPFEKILSGQKTIEIRCYDDKRRQIKVGDTITFTREPDHFNQSMMVEVVSLYPFPNFKSLFKAFTPEKFGYMASDSIEKMLKGIYMIYSPEREQREGVVGIEIKLL